MANKTTYELALEIGGKIQSSLEKSVGGVNKKLDSIGKAAKTAAKIATAAFAAVKIGDFVKGAVSVYADFDQAMANTAATANATKEEYAKLEAAALEMGKKTTKTATEASEALGYMALAGWDVDTSISALEPVLRLSEATNMDLATCSDLVTNSMSALGLTVNELPGYLDVACKANNKSSQTAQELMEAYIGCGGVLNNLNVAVEDSATALGVLANRGYKGSEGGKKLNTVLINLTSGTGQAGKMMEKLGISAFDSKGKFIGLQKTLELVNEATKGLTEEERSAALAAIGGKTQIDTLNDLLAGLNTITEDGRTEWQALSDELYNAQGAMMDMAGKVTDTLPGAMAKFGSAVDDAKIQLCKIFAPMAKDAIVKVADYIPNITDKVAEFTQGLSEKAVPAVASSFRFLASTGKIAFENIKAKIEENKPSIEKVIAVALDLKDKFFEAFERSKPMISYIATVALPAVVNSAMKVIGAAATVYQKMNEWGILKPVILGIAAAIVAMKMVGFAKDTLNAAKAVKALVTVFAAQKKAMLANIALKVKDKAETLYLYALYAKDAVVKGISTAATWAQTAAMTAWNAICTVGTAVTTALGAAFTFLTSPIGLVILAIAAVVAIGVILYKNWDTIKEKAKQLGDRIVGVFNNLRDRASAAIQAFADKFPIAFAFISSVLSAARDTIAEKLQNIKAAYDEHGGGIKGAAAATMEAIKSYYTAGYSFINNLTGGKLEEMRSKFSEKLSAVKQTVQDGLNAIKGFFSNCKLELPKIKTPHFSVSGDFSIVPPKVPKVKVDWYKEGGILTGPTIFGANGGSLMGGGEAGKEAVLPLSELWSNMKSIVAGAVHQPESGGASDMFGKIRQLVEGGRIAGQEGGSVTKELYNTVNNNNTVNRTSETSSSDDSQKIVYSPQVTIQGNASKEDVQAALDISQEKFNKMMAEYNRQNRRISFAPA